MYKDRASRFYKSSKWIKCRQGFMSSKSYVCERCGGVATICHHKIYLDSSNIDDPEVSLNWENLQSVCLDCHNRIHGNNEVIREGLTFDLNGNISESPMLK